MAKCSKSSPSIPHHLQDLPLLETDRESEREERGFEGFEGIEEEEGWNMEGRKVEMPARILLLN